MVRQFTVLMLVYLKRYSSTLIRFIKFHYENNYSIMWMMNHMQLITSFVRYCININYSDVTKGIINVDIFNGKQLLRMLVSWCNQLILARNTCRLIKWYWVYISSQMPFYISSFLWRNRKYEITSIWLVFAAHSSSIILACLWYRTIVWDNKVPIINKILQLI